jgi:hypothetical protein
LRVPADSRVRRPTSVATLEVVLLTASLRHRPLFRDQNTRVFVGQVQDVAHLTLGDVHAVETIRQFGNEHDFHVQRKKHPKRLPLCLSFQASGMVR